MLSARRKKINQYHPRESKGRFLRKGILRRLVGQKGQAAVEYVLITSLIALVVIASLSLLGMGIERVFRASSDKMEMAAAEQKAPEYVRTIEAKIGDILKAGISLIKELR